MLLKAGAIDLINKNMPWRHTELSATQNVQHENYILIM